MAKRRKQEAPGVPEWVVTYGDMMSLLLCFFILLAAFSELKKPDEYQKVIDAIQQAFGVEGGDSVIFDPAHPASIENLDTQGLLEKIEKERSRSDANEKTTVGEDMTTSTLFDGRKWTIGKPISFGGSEYELTEENKQILRDVIAPKVHGSNRMFLVLGHAWGAEDRVGGLDYWELSFERARVVHRFLVEECGVDANSMSMLVAGASQPLSIESMAEFGGSNRRVEVFMTDTPLSEIHPDPSGTGRGG